MQYSVQDGFPINDQGTYKVRLADVNEDDRFVRFVFEFVDVPIAQYACGVCPADLVPGTKFYKWLSIFNGGDLNIGDSVDPTAYVGQTVEAIIKKRQKEGIEYLNIVDIVS